MNKIINGECLAELKKLKSESVDLIVIDPPYKVISGGKPNKKNTPSGILSKNNGKIFKHNNIEIKDYIGELYRILKEGTHCYIMINLINLEELIKQGKKAGFKLHNLLIWKKNNKTPNRWYMKNTEYIIFFRKGKAKKINSSDGQILEYKNIIGNKLHPTEKPVKLIERMIYNSSSIGDTVLDCFMGSGSAGVACKNLNRNFIGIELDKEYFNIAKKRLKK